VKCFINAVKEVKNLPFYFGPWEASSQDIRSCLTQSSQPNELRRLPRRLLFLIDTSSCRLTFSLALSPLSVAAARRQLTEQIS